MLLPTVVYSHCVDADSVYTLAGQVIPLNSLFDVALTTGATIAALGCSANVPLVLGAASRGVRIAVGRPSTRNWTEILKEGPNVTLVEVHAIATEAIPASLGGWAVVSESVRRAYSLAAEPGNYMTMSNHPAMMAIAGLSGIWTDSVAALLAAILDPRYFGDLYEATDNIIAFCGLTTEPRAGSRRAALRAEAIRACRDVPAAKHWRTRGGDAAAARTFLTLLVASWVFVLSPHPELLPSRDFFVIEPEFKAFLSTLNASARRSQSVG